MHKRVQFQKATGALNERETATIILILTQSQEVNILSQLQIYLFFRNTQFTNWRQKLICEILKF